MPKIVRILTNKNQKSMPYLWNIKSRFLNLLTNCVILLPGTHFAHLYNGPLISGGREVGREQGKRKAQWVCLQPCGPCFIPSSSTFRIPHKILCYKRVSPRK